MAIDILMFALHADSLNCLANMKKGTDKACCSCYNRNWMAVAEKSVIIAEHQQKSCFSSARSGLMYRGRKYLDLTVFH